MKRKIKSSHIRQHDEKDCGAACLSMVSSYYGLRLPIAKFRELICVDNQGANIYGLVTGAKQIGFDTDALEGSLGELEDGVSKGEIKCPFIARIVNPEGYEHFITVFGISKNKFLIGDPAMAGVTKIPRDYFKKIWQGQIVTFQPNADFKAVNASRNVLSKFFGYIFRQKRALTWIFVISLIISGVNMFGTVIFQYVLDSVMGTPKTSGNSFYENVIIKLETVFSNLDTVCIIILCLYLLKCFISILRSYMLALLSKKVSVSVTTDLYNHMIDLPFGFFGTRKTGELISRFRNADEIKEAVSSAVLTVMIDTLMAAVFGIVLLFISRTLFLVTLVAVAVYACLVVFFKKPIRRINHKIMEKDALMTSYLKETIDGAAVIKANQYSRVSKHKLKKLVLGRENKYVKGCVIGSVQDSLVSLISSAFVVVLLWTGAYLCAGDVITIGALFTFYYMINYFMNPVSSLINLQPTLQAAAAAAERVNDILDAEVERDTGDEKFQNGDICIENLKFSYGNRDEVLKGVDLNIKRGQKIAIVGESGCGKTTLAKLIMRFYQPSSGSVAVNGISIDNFALNNYRNRTAYVPQDIFLLSDTIRNNLIMGAKSVSESYFRYVCRLCMVDEFVKNLPLGYDTVLEESGSNLSAGQRQRIAIARALLRKPDVLILDEATSNLDSVTEHCIQSAIDSFSDDTTCIVIAHRLSTIRNCDNICVMYNGVITEQGTHEELIELDGLYASYYNQ